MNLLDRFEEYCPTTPIHSMHKYWGRKPANELNHVIKNYSNVNDVIFDPFSGYGGLGIESLILKRNVILNDLNPAANFISRCILNKNINLKKFKKLFLIIKNKYEDFNKRWYSYNNNEILTILRDNQDKPISIKYKDKKTKKNVEHILTPTEVQAFLKIEKDFKIKTWFPNKKMIVNSRISVKQGMVISDLFSKRSLITQSYLFALINELDNSNEKELLKFAFTSNLANCSKLVPPIYSRGSMAQGAWMTGFYIGKTYLENNTFHYFENRIFKIIKGKQLFIDLAKNNNWYKILNEDAKHTSLKNESVDLIFTDFPYGDTVPYFEQSQLWNAWMQFKPDYRNEIVISDSKERDKKITNFRNDIYLAIKDINRVLKTNKYFIFTFHSIDGNEWKSIIDSLKKCNFKYVDSKIMVQKTLPPRQLNRINSIKGDILAIYKKIGNGQSLKENLINFNSELSKQIKKLNKSETYSTGDLINLIVQIVLKSGSTDKINFKEIINKHFQLLNKNQMWKIKEK